MISGAKETAPAVVVGGGISGLAVAYYLSRHSIRSVGFEKSGRLGGLIRTDHLDGCDLEAGPDSFISNKTALADLATDLGISDKIIGSNDAGRRTFIVRGGRLVPMPDGMVLMVPGDLNAANASPLFSAEAKEGFVREVAARPRTREGDFSIGEFVRDHFGSEVLQTVAAPLLAGVFGGDVSLLSARSVLPRFVEYERSEGSLIRGVQRERSTARHAGGVFRSFEGGMQTVVDALERSIVQSCRIVPEEVQSVAPTGRGTWTVQHNDGTLETHQVILACPAHVNAKLLSGSAPLLSREFAAIPYSSALLATFVYECDPDAPPMEGFGFLVPRTEGLTIAAATFVGTKFPSRLPPNRRAVRAFIVGDQAEVLLSASDSEVLRVVQQDLLRLAPQPGILLFSTLYRWPNSMPQYVLGHSDRVSRINSFLRQHPGLWLCGNAYDGVGLPDCVRLARQVADEVSTRASKRQRVS